MTVGRHDVRLLADDLTGALDAAVRLRRLAGELPVTFCARDAGRAGALALSTNSRDLPAEAATQMVANLAGFWRDDALCFKKIDSLWRGNTVTEIAAVAQSGWFATIIVTSAFPDQQRMMRGGRPWHRARAREKWIASAADPAALLAGRGVAAHVGHAGECPDALAGLWLLDAETDADLAAIVRLGGKASKPLLWCGSAGLAGALAAHAPPPEALRLPPEPMLGVVGSRHAVTRVQVEEAARRGVAETVDVAADPSGWPQVIARAGALLRANRSVILWYSPRAELSEDVSSRTMSAFFDVLARGIVPPGATFVTGGDTLLRLCRAAGTTELLPRREIFPGVPVAAVQGGRWDGVTLVSKSGAFGAPDLLAELLGMTKGDLR